MIELEELSDATSNVIASIKVVGIGGAGGNTVNSIKQAGNSTIECIVANTDSQALHLSKADKVISLGVKSAKGLGTGASPDLGKRAAQEDLDKIMEAIGDADIVFLTAGMGGGTGSGGLPVVAQALRERNILSIAIVTKPFIFEGKRRTVVAEKALENLRKEVDTLIVIPNQKLLETVGSDVSMIDAFGMINDILGSSVKSISDIITKPGHINVDFADVRTIMKDMGLAVMGTGTATGKDRAQQATIQAISSPLLENMSVKGAQGVLLNITGGKNLGLHEISQAASVVYEQVHEDATIILGSVIDESLTDAVTVTVIATGFTPLAVDVKTQTDTHVFDVSNVTVASKPVEIPKMNAAETSKILASRVIDEPTTVHNSRAEVKETKMHEKLIVSEKLAENKQVLQEESQQELREVTGDPYLNNNDLDTPAYLRKSREQEKDS